MQSPRNDFLEAAALRECLFQLFHEVVLPTNQFRLLHVFMQFHRELTKGEFVLRIGDVLRW